MENTSQQPPVPQVPFGHQPPIPNSSTVLVLGIIALVFSVIWCYWIGSLVAVILGIICLVSYNGAKKTYDQNPSHYSSGSLSNLNAGRVCGIIGLVLGGIGFLVLILVVVVYGMALSTLFSTFGS
jgi:hypothetical protein